jgi:hypothetical protein
MAEESSLEKLTVEQRQDLSLARLTKQLLSNPETRGQVQRLLTKADSNLKFPELVLQDEIAKVREEATERAKSAEEEARKLRAELKQKDLHAKVSAAGLELKPVVDLMEKHGLAPTDENYDMAIEVLTSRQSLELAESTPDFLPAETPETKDMWKDPEKWRTSQAEKVLREFRGRMPPRFQ